MNAELEYRKEIGSGTKGLLILDMQTGAMDGWYSDQKLAEEMRANLVEQYPEGHWVIVQRVEHASVYTGIGHEMFWTRRLPKWWKR